MKKSEFDSKEVKDMSRSEATVYQVGVLYDRISELEKFAKAFIEEGRQRADKKFYLIKRGLYWRFNSRGYTNFATEAQEYTLEEACYACHDDGEPVIMIQVVGAPYYIKGAFVLFIVCILLLFQLFNLIFIDSSSLPLYTFDSSQ